MIYAFAQGQSNARLCPPMEMAPKDIDQETQGLIWQELRGQLGQIVVVV